LIANGRKTISPAKIHGLNHGAGRRQPKKEDRRNMGGKKCRKVGKHHKNTAKMQKKNHG